MGRPQLVDKIDGLGGGEKGLAAVVMAAGRGTRMKSERAKALMPVAGKPMVYYPLEAVKRAGIIRRVVVIGHQAEKVRQAIGDGCEFALQEPQQGTGDALKRCRPIFSGFYGTLLSICADTPLIDPETIRKLVGHHRRTGAGATVISVELEDPGRYGRIIRDAEGRVVSIVEAQDADQEQKKVKEINAGLYCFEAPEIFDILERLKPHFVARTGQEELFVTDAIGELVRAGVRVEAIKADSEKVTFGINTPEELLRVEEILLQKSRGGK